MSDTNSAPLDGFMMDLGKVDTTKTLPNSGDYVASVSKLEFKPSKKNPSNQVLWVTLALRDSCQSAPSPITGQSQTIPPGYEVVEFIPIWEIENSIEQYQVRIAKLYDAAMGTNDATRPSSLNLQDMIGKFVVVKLATAYNEKFSADSTQIKKISKLTQ